VRRDTAHARPTPRVDELDALRGLAALAIVVYHWKANRLPFGWAAVDLFFVLSGYLITGIILRHGASPGFLPRFYLRRGLRVWPIYDLTVAALVAAGPWLARPHYWRGLPYVLTFTQGVPLAWGGDAPVFSWYLVHTWTLAIEEQFYLVWPALVLLAGRRRVVPLALACAAGSALARGAGLSAVVLAGRGDGLALGALLAGLLEGVETGEAPGKRRARLGGWCAALAGGSLVALLAIRGAAGPLGSSINPTWPGLTVLAFNTLWFGTVGLIACRAGSPGLAALRHPLLRSLGQISYGLYLYHWVVMTLVSDLVRRLGYHSRPWWLTVLMFALCFAAAWASWTFIERPILRLKDRFEYGPGHGLRGVRAARRAGSSARIS
jgi:peptidoglycan/LPS O-acetylase OafA/YrhL